MLNARVKRRIRGIGKKNAQENKIMQIKGERRERVQCNEKRREESADNVEKSEIMKIIKGLHKERRNSGISGCGENCIGVEGGE